MTTVVRKKGRSHLSSEETQFQQKIKLFFFKKSIFAFIIIIIKLIYILFCIGEQILKLF